MQQNYIGNHIHDLLLSWLQHVPGLEGFVNFKNKANNGYFSFIHPLMANTVCLQEYFEYLLIYNCFNKKQRRPLPKNVSPVSIEAACSNILEQILKMLGRNI